MNAFSISDLDREVIDNPNDLAPSVLEQTKILKNILLAKELQARPQVNEVRRFVNAISNMTEYKYTDRHDKHIFYSVYEISSAIKCHSDMLIGVNIPLEQINTINAMVSEMENFRKSSGKVDYNKFNNTLKRYRELSKKFDNGIRTS